MRKKISITFLIFVPKLSKYGTKLFNGGGVGSGEQAQNLQKEETQR